MVDKGREFNVGWLHKVISTASLIKNGEFMNSI